MVTDISGKIGGQTFGTGPAGSYVKNSGTPRKSITLTQQRQMQAMGTTAQKWRSLTQAQRDVFNSASPQYPYLNRVGETKFYSGFAIFTQLQNYSDFAIGPILPVPLPKHTFSLPTVLDQTDAPYSIAITLGNCETGVMYRIYGSQILSTGVSNSYINKFYLNQSTVVSGGTVYLPVGNQMLEKWGEHGAPGKFFWHVDAVHQSTGQVYKNIVSSVYEF